MKWCSVDIIKWHEVQVNDWILWNGKRAQVISYSASDKEKDFFTFEIEGERFSVDRGDIYYRIKKWK